MADVEASELVRFSQREYILIDHYDANTAGALLIAKRKGFKSVYRSGAIALDELETAIRNLGLEQTRDELDKIIDEVDQRGNHQIDFDEFCVVMRRLYMKKRSWNEVVKECFSVFDRSESSVISKKDFQYILRELGDITDNQIIDEIFLEADVDGNGLIDYDEFSYMVKNYMTDDDIN
ncbi:EF hand [Teladorsagia circumcincta]|uniref:EF hand n=1 Tax=Teladorsagia circumcincta TaxID=45464 RepID=A0A2G9U0R6_TELCI|nr:EF hand [Teladorsagia circumcincta]